jgi:uncharacterized protein with FMN-binding domain
MRRAIVALFITAAIVVPLLNFKAAEPALTTPAARPATAMATTGAGATAPSGAAGGASGTAVGDDIQHQYGDVQVKVTMQAGKVTGVQTLAMNGVDGRSQGIDAQAEPLLRQETLQAQSASIDTVSGATYTSDAYITSLQSAIDRVLGA